MSDSPLRYRSSASGFLGIDDDLGAVDPESARVVVIPFGLESSVTYGRGTSKGPAAIIEASHEVELFDEDLWCEPFRAFGGVATIAEESIPEDTEAALSRLTELTSAVLNDGRFPLVLGGEHAITPGAIRSVVARWPEVTLLHFDAHADLRDGYLGERFSHAAAIRRCLDFPGVSVVSVGVRNISAEEAAYLDACRDRVHVYWARGRNRWDERELTARLEGRTVWVTFDVDAFDASLMPATGTPEPGGLFWDEANDVLRAASRVCTIIGADVCELAPIDGYHAADFVAARLAYRIISLAMRADRDAAVDAELPPARRVSTR